MSKHTQDRENLMRDAKSYVHRMSFPLESSLALSALSAPSAPSALSMLGDETGSRRSGPQEESWEVFLGIKRDQSWSLFFSQDWVLHFNSQNELRRLFWGDVKLSAEGGRLQSLRPSASQDKRIELNREWLPPKTELKILGTCQRILRTVLDNLEKANRADRSEIHAADELVELQFPATWLHLLETCAAELKIADAPSSI